MFGLCALKQPVLDLVAGMAIGLDIVGYVFTSGGRRTGWRGGLTATGAAGWRKRHPFAAPYVHEHVQRHAYSEVKPSWTGRGGYACKQTWQLGERPGELCPRDTGAQLVPLRAFTRPRERSRMSE